MKGEDIPGGPVVENLPSSAGDMGLIPGWGLRSTCLWVTKPRRCNHWVRSLSIPCPATREAPPTENRESPCASVESQCSQKIKIKGVLKLRSLKVVASGKVCFRKRYFLSCWFLRNIDLLTIWNSAEFWEREMAYLASLSLIWPHRPCLWAHSVSISPRTETVETGAQALPRTCHVAHTKP